MKSLLARPLRNRYLFASDLILLTAAAYFSYVLRLETFALGVHWPGCLLFTGLALGIIPLVFYRAGIYARYWRYASVEELVLLAGSVTISVLLVGGLSLLVVSLPPIPWPLPRSIPLIFLLLALVATASPRLALRLWAPSSLTLTHRSGRRQSQAVLIMGAGDAGAMIAREIRRNPHLGLEPVGFLDDDPAKHHIHIHGVRVLGDRHAIPEMAREYRAEQVIIAMPTAAGRTIREIVAICNQAGVRARIIPGIYELVDGSVSVNQLRDVQIEDLLRREPVRTDISAVSGMLRGRRVLVTGAGGSIGSELCRQIIRCGPAELVLVGHGENSIFEIYNELEKELKGEGSRVKGEVSKSNLQPSILHSEPSSFNVAPCTFNLHPIIADIRFHDRIRAVFEAYRPEIVFHAGAHKHVPLMESNEVEAITNNVLGTRNVVEAAVATGVERLLMISTDKAVNPTSVMGASKRVAEMVVTRAGSGGAGERGSGGDGETALLLPCPSALLPPCPSAPLPLCSPAPPPLRPPAPPPICTVVRFGNVLGSRGSVVPFFRQQIAAGGPVTVTHPDMRRYFMTIPEAVQLVLQAAVIGTGGEVFALDMGEPVRIADLAHDLIRLSGLEPGRDIEVVYTGLRPGEKLFEELFLGSEAYVRTQHEKIFVCPNGTERVEGGRVEGARLKVEVDALIAAAQREDAGEVRRLLKLLVPEYQGDGGTR